MNSISSMNSVSRRLGRRLLLAGIAGVFALAGVSTASAQATTGDVFGKAPAGYSVAVRSDATGAGRTVRVDTAGRYSASHLPNGVYTVTLLQNDQPVAKHLNVPVYVGRGVEVDFNCSEIKCDQVAAAK
ncbi:MAG: Oar protein [Rhodanobacter sp. 68-29]|nr:carboxypeptidase regulatory-like domain-containing protein [Rhodanobacter sp.]ODU72655.1 MAG: Oar protein [Rhodanobacter sp. SCN 69-32]OJY61222.1 MAG: Oar protein [Rhodanobacter sp. 68-29]